MPSTNTQVADSAADSLSNRFEALNVEESSNEFLRAPDISKITPPYTADAQYEAERDSMEEAYLALKLILEDYRKFRTVVYQT